MITRVRGFHDEHSVASGWWVGVESVIGFPAADHVRYLEFWVLSEFYDLSQTLTVRAGDRRVVLALAKGWSPASIELPAGAAVAQFAVNKPLPASQHPGDPRELAVRLRDFVVHADPVRHRRVAARQTNAALNARELLDGLATPASTPTSLGIDMYGVCNVKPPCVYCEWDSSKAAEGPFVDTPFTTDTLREWGPLFEQSTNLINCSIGEPFMMKNVDELLDAFAEAGKRLELTTNGQILTDANIRRLVGRPINLYISFDAATPETYARLRNRRFELLVDNVRRLVEAKGGQGLLPVVNVVFMPMRANLHELDRVVTLCAQLRVDYLVLRPLNFADHVELTWERAGYRFDYERELLPFDELVRASGRAAALCRRAGVTLSDQMDFGGSLGSQFAAWYEEGERSVAPLEPAEDLAAAPAGVDAAVGAVSGPGVADDLGAGRTPACAEPWKSLYILRRGVFPCCYGAKPLAPMDGYAGVWTSPALQEIRRVLARGQFPSYCLDSPACPIVRKARADRDRSAAGRLARVARGAGQRLRRQWQTLTWARQWAGIRARRVVTEPAYVRHHARRLWARFAGRR